MVTRVLFTGMPMLNGNEGMADTGVKGQSEKQQKSWPNALKASTSVLPEEHPALQAPHLLKAS